MSKARVDHYIEMQMLSVNYSTVRQQFEEIRHAYDMAVRDAAAVGYAQALKEVRESFIADQREYAPRPDPFDFDAAILKIENFAAEHDIDLDD